MDAELVNTFIVSAENVLQTELAEPINIGQVSAQIAPYTSQEVTTLIGVTGNIEGVLLFGVSEQTALLLVSCMMGQSMATLDELAQSGIAELGNVIAGTAITGLADHGYNCTISPPTLILGKGTVISTVNIKRLVIPLLTSCGTVEMQIALKLNGHKPTSLINKGIFKR